MEQPIKHTDVHDKDDELSLKSIVLKLRDWVRYLLTKWLYILIAVILGGLLGLVIALNAKPKYVGELTFVLDDGSSGQLSSYAGIASQFGIDLGGGAGVSVFSGDNILEFLKSRLIVEDALLTPVTQNNKTVSLAELFIDTYNLRKDWRKKSEELGNIKLPFDRKRETFSRMQDSVLFTLFKKIEKKHLQVTKPDKKMSFISVSCTTNSEAFSKAFVENLVEKATHYYIATKIKHSKTNVDILQAKADSIERLLNIKTYSAAVAQDVNINPIKRVATVKSEVATRDRVVLQTIYGEVIKNLELSKISMAQETPVIQIIDTPILPLTIEKIGKLMAIIGGFFAGGLLSVIVLVVRKVYKEIIA